MSATIDYFFTSISPWAYLGHRAFLDVAARHGAAIRYRPVNLSGVWQASGAVPLAQRSPTRQRYRLIEMQRTAHRRGVTLNLHPKFFPADPTLADLTAIAMLARQADPTGFIGRVFTGVWVRDENIADEETIAGYLEAESHSARAVLDDAGGDAAAATREQNTQAAVAADAIGVPAYVLEGEVFWGQDRIDDLDFMLECKRPPFRAD